MNKLNVLIFLFFLITKIASSSVLEGQNKEYAGENIIFYTYSDPVSKKEIELFTIQFDEEGKFKTEVQISTTTFVFCEFGIYRGEFYLVPKQNIQLVFPRLQKKSFADQKNPFFEPVIFWFKIQNDNGLNQKVLDFEARFGQLTQKFFNQLYFRQSREIYDSVVSILNQDFPDSKNPVFDTHKKLKLKFLESEVFRKKPENGSAVLSAVSEDFWEYPAFISFFERTFSNRLSFDAKTEKGGALKKAIAQTDVGYLNDFVKNKYNLTGNIVQLTIIKMLYDGFYSGEFSQEAILHYLHSEKWEKNSDTRIKQITQNVLDKLTLLLPGTKAPVICLDDINGKQKCTDENHGKFKYLVFADVEMVVCQEQLKYLTKIEEQFQKHLEIILVLRKTDISEIKAFLNKNQVPGMKLVDETGEFIRKYNIKAFPACYLLDENHKVVFENTKAPLDGFEQQFSSFLQQELFRKQRNQTR